MGGFFGEGLWRCEKSYGEDGIWMKFWFIRVWTGYRMFGRLKIVRSIVDLVVNGGVLEGGVGV